MLVDTKITGNLVTLYPARLAYAGDMVLAMDTAATQNLQFFREMPTVDRQRAYLRRMVDSPTDYLFAVHRRSDDRLIGTVGLHEYDEHNHNARLGALIFRPEDRHGGYGTDAMNCVLSFGFDRHLGLHKVYVRLLTRNAEAFRHYTALGFVEEAPVMREEYCLDGEYFDMRLLSLLKREWDAMGKMLEGGV